MRISGQLTAFSFQPFWGSCHMAESQPVIDAQNIVFNYGSREVLKGLTLAVRSGEIFGMLGANGAGKTTLIRILVGMLKPDSGSIRVHGEAPTSKQARQVGYMPQLSALYQELSIRENVDFFGRMYGMSDKSERAAAVDDAIKIVGLWERRDDSILDLSGGMRQRVSLAISLVHRPALLLLDEPTAGLDPDLRATFWERFREMADAGTTMVLSSHTMDDAVHCDRLAFLREGQMIAVGTPQELREATGDAMASLQDAFIYFLRKAER